jgi:hypothetical protein
VDSVLATAVAAASASGAKITAATVQASVDFALADGGDPETAAPATSQASTTAPSAGGTSTGTGTSADTTSATSQFRMKITVQAANADKIVSFLEALRTGSRLLRINGVAVTSATVGEGVSADVSVDAFVQKA